MHSPGRSAESLEPGASARDSQEIPLTGESSRPLDVWGEAGSSSSEKLLPQARCCRQFPGPRSLPPPRRRQDLSCQERARSGAVLVVAAALTALGAPRLWSHIVIVSSWPTSGLLDTGPCLRSAVPASVPSSPWQQSPQSRSAWPSGGRAGGGAGSLRVTACGALSPGRRRCPRGCPGQRQRGPCQQPRPGALAARVRACLVLCRRGAGDDADGCPV